MMDEREVRALDAAETARMLESYGIPMPPQRIAKDPDEAVHASAELGYPVAVKVVADGISHKSDIGGVKLALAGPEAVRAAFGEIAAAAAGAGSTLRGVLVQRMAPAGLEVIVGAKRDPVFGPVVLVGLGGVFVELIKDAALRPAPVDADGARAMLRQLRGAPLLAGYRGAPPRDVDALVDLIVRVGRLVAERAEVFEMDLNPVLLGPAGHGALAVDARIATRRAAPRAADPGAGPAALPAIHRMLNPRSVAVVGASANPGKPGGRLLHYLVKHGYGGRIYPINPGEREIGSLRAYESVADLPEVPDLACIMVPERAAVEVLDECGRAGVKAAILYTAGFAEVGEEGARRQERLVETAKRHGIRVCGPNTVGVVNQIVRCCAAFGMAFEAETVPAGDIAFLTQSGALGGSLLSRCWTQGIGFSRWICTGNEADLTLADYLLYLADDPETRVIAMFIEAVRDPEVFRAACRKAREAGRKVVAYKTGRSQVGRRAVQSHTGSLAGDDAVYDAVFRDLGVARVHDLQALSDAAQALSWQPLPRGRRVAVVSTSGGACSVVADECEKMGLELPLLREETRERIARIIPPFGASQNPVDITVQVTVNPRMFAEVLDLILNEPDIDALLMMLTTNADPPAIEVARGIAAAARKGGKPVVVARVGAEFLAPKSLAVYREHRIPVFPMPDRAVKALRAMMACAGVIDDPRSA